jgi:hypothetical protein
VASQASATRGSPGSDGASPAASPYLRHPSEEDKLSNETLVANLP